MNKLIRNEKAGKWSSAAGFLAILWMGVIFFFSAQADEESTAVSGGVSYRLVGITRLFLHLNIDEEQIREIVNAIEGFVRKSAHMAEFAVLAVLLYLWIDRWKVVRAQRACAAVVFAALYACSDEIHQLFVPGRAGRIFDVMLDSLGALTGMVLFLLLEQIVMLIRRRKHKAGRPADASEADRD